MVENQNFTIHTNSQCAGWHSGGSNLSPPSSLDHWKVQPHKCTFGLQSITPLSDWFSENLFCSVPGNGTRYVCTPPVINCASNALTGLITLWTWLWKYWMSMCVV